MRCWIFIKRLLADCLFFSSGSEGMHEWTTEKSYLSDAVVDIAHCAKYFRNFVPSWSHNKLENANCVGECVCGVVVDEGRGVYKLKLLAAIVADGTENINIQSLKIAHPK